ncbi:MAG: hypothetical protein HY822_23915 [Acidobacteria bacterium]|nr:hypothetical protein [Acidobacteriota bacterium]
MLAFRKWFLALALVTLTVAVASAQVNVPAFQCVANAGVPPIVRAEGLAELVGDLVLNCTGGYPAGSAGGPASVPQVNVQIFLNTNVTSKLLDGSSSNNESLLMIDEPTATEQNGCGASGGCTVPNRPLVPGGVYKNWTDTSVTPNVAYQPKNVFQGKLQGANSIVWLGVPVDAPGTTFTRIIRITNVRANANQLGVSSTLIPTQIVAFISATGTTSIPINNPQQTVAWIQTGLSFSVRYPNGDSGAPDPFSQCSSNNKDLFGDTTKTNATVSLRLRFSEGFASAFKTAYTSGPTYGGVTADQATPGQIYQGSESGFFNSLTNFPNSVGGRADQGTRLRAVFNSVPAGTRLFATLTNRDPSSSKTGILVNVAADGSGGYVPVPKLTTTSSSDANFVSYDIAEIPVFGGTGSVVWEVTKANALSIDSWDFGIVLAYKADTSNSLPGLGTATVNGMLAPVSTITTSSGVAPVPRFADTSSSKTVFKIIQCVTNLLFPFVSQQGGFDTGLAIVNTSKDPWGHATEAGTCTLNYYGDTNGGAAPPAQTSGVVPAGDYLVWTLYSGGKFGVTATPGFQGYIIAQCTFRWAHGYAFISNLGDVKWAQGYLALIMDQAITRPDVATGESLGN